MRRRRVGAKRKGIFVKYVRNGTRAVFTYRGPKGKLHKMLEDYSSSDSDS